MRFPWGIMGYNAPKDGELPRIDLHTARSRKDDRDQFLFSSMPILVAEFVKATQFLMPRYMNDLEEGLNQEERNVLREVKKLRATDSRDSSNSLPRMARDESVRLLTEGLATFAQQIADLEEDKHSTDVAREDIERIFQRYHAVPEGAPADNALLRPIELLDRQMRSDLAYFRTTETRGRDALAARRTLAEIEQTRVQERLAIIGVILAGLAIVFGLAQILQPLALVWRLSVGVGGGIAWSLIAWRWLTRQA